MCVNNIIYSLLVCMFLAMTGYDDLVHASHVLYCIAATLVDVLYCTVQQAIG